MPPHVQVGVRQPQREILKQRAVVIVDEPANDGGDEHDEANDLQTICENNDASARQRQRNLQAIRNRSRAPSDDNDAETERDAHDTPRYFMHSRTLLGAEHRGGTASAKEDGQSPPILMTQAPKATSREQQNKPQHRNLVQQLHWIPERGVKEEAANTYGHLDHQQPKHLRTYVGVGRQEGAGQQHPDHVRKGVDRFSNPGQDGVICLAPIELGILLTPAPWIARPTQVVWDAEEVACYGETPC